MYIVIYIQACIHTYISSMHTAKYTIHKYTLFLFKLQIEGAFKLYKFVSYNVCNDQVTITDISISPNIYHTYHFVDNHQTPLFQSFHERVLYIYQLICLLFTK